MTDFQQTPPDIAAPRVPMRRQTQCYSTATWRGLAVVNGLLILGLVAVTDWQFFKG